MPVYLIVLLVVVATVLAGGIGFLLAASTVGKRQRLELGELEAKHQQRLLDVEAAAKEKLLEAKEEAVKIRTAAEQEARETRAPAHPVGRTLPPKEENLEKRGEDLA